jgi:LysM repeat protein
VKNSNQFAVPKRRRFKNYKHPRFKRTAKRNSVFSLISDYIEKQQKSQKFASENRFLEEGAHFQIFGMCILTVAVVLSFQGFVTSDSIGINAEDDQSEVRLLTNFQYNPSNDTKESRLQDFSIAPIVDEDIVSESPAVPSQTQETEPTVPEPTTHIVASGDNVYTIAAEYDVSPQEIIRINNLVAPYTINIGDELRVN